MQLRQSALLPRHSTTQSAQNISSRVHFGPQSLELHQVLLIRQLCLSQLIHCLHAALEQLLEGGEIFLQDIAVKVSTHTLEVGISLRQDISVSEEKESLELNADCLFVVVLGHYSTRAYLLATANFKFLKDGLSLFHKGVDLGEVLIHVQSTPPGLLLPLLTVSVAFKSDCPRLLHQFLYDGLNVFPLPQSFTRYLYFLSKDGSNNCECIAGVLRRSQGSELKSIASVRIGTGSVSISVFLKDIKIKVRDGVSEIEMRLVGLTVQQIGKGSAQEDGNDAGRCLVSSQPDLVSRSGDGSHEQPVVLEYCFEIKQDEQLVQLQMLPRVGLVHCKQVLEASIWLDIVERPIGVLAATINLLEWFFVKQGSQTVLVEHLLQNLHSDHILIDGQSCIIANGSNLILVKCYFVVLGPKGNAYGQQFFLHLHQGGPDSLGDGGIVVLTKLLVAWGEVASQCAPNHTKVVASIEAPLESGEELLLQTQQDHCLLCVYSQFIQQFDSTFLENLLRLAEEGFVIQSVSVMRDQESRDIEDPFVFANVQLRQGVPDSISSGSMRAPQAAGWKATSITFTLNERLPRKHLLYQFLSI